MKIDTIAAVIVTYNRSTLLDKVLEAIAAQNRLPDGVIIIDNASTDNTQEIINNHIKNKKINIDVVCMPKNIGGAGGFHAGAKKAYIDGYHAMWFMDDDTVPEEDALLHLERSLCDFEAKTPYKPAFICSTVLWKNDDLCEMNIPSVVWDWPRFVVDHSVALVESCSFVSVLVRREKMKEAGYPIKEFFIWYDDVEYTKRLSGYGYPGLMSFKSKVHHLLPENKGVNFYMITDESAWKYCYGIRNEAAFIFHKKGFFHYLKFGASRLRQVLHSKTKTKTKWSLIKSFACAAKFKINIEKP